jgi:hypothetical protein
MRAYHLQPKSWLTFNGLQDVMSQKIQSCYLFCFDFKSTLVTVEGVLDWMIGFIAAYTRILTNPDYRQYSTVADLHTL